VFIPRILKGASRELERLDPAVARRLVDRIRWLAENIEHIKPEPLEGDLAGFLKLLWVTIGSFTKSFAGSVSWSFTALVIEARSTRGRNPGRSIRAP
jgi:hypothetical protein